LLPGMSGRQCTYSYVGASSNGRLGCVGMHCASYIPQVVYLCPVEFQLYMEAREFLRQELREEHTHFT